MSKFKIIPALLISIVNAYTARPVQSVQLDNPCQSFVNLNCLTERSLSKEIVDVLPGQNQVAVAWGDLFQWLGRHRGTKGIRRPNANPKSFYCLMAPGKLENNEDFLKATTTEVYNRRPLFLWHGEMKKIEVYAHGTAEPIWSKKLEEKDRYVVYGGDKPLTPNKLGYYWQVEVKEPDEETQSTKTPRKTFTIMDGKAAEGLEKKLEAIDRQDLSPLELAEKRIAVFREPSFGTNKDSALSGDILREMYTLETLTPEMVALKEKGLCPDEEEAVTS